MSNKAAFDELKPQITQIKQVELPTMPMDVYNQQAENLAIWAREDLSELQARGLTPELLDDLEKRTDASRYAQGIWFKERHARQEAEMEWREQSPAAYKLRDRLIDEFEFAFYQKPSLLARVDEVKKGTGHADMIQDLTNLALLGKDNQALLEDINTDVALLDTALATSDAMATLLAMANGEKAEDNATKHMRDQAYTYLKEVVDEVRRYGRFVFRQNKARLVGYQNSYKKAHS